MAQLDTILFDLDGVSTRMARIHAEAWKQLFDAYLRTRADQAGELFQPFEIETDYRTYVDGVPRDDSFTRVSIPARDAEFLSHFGAELILEIARFWASIARYNADLDRDEILGVVGPDEYHTAYPEATAPGLNNNAYTNVMAVWCMLMTHSGQDKPNHDAAETRLGKTCAMPSKPPSRALPIGSNPTCRQMKTRWC
jgi:hypothetical protein